MLALRRFLGQVRSKTPQSQKSRPKAAFVEWGVLSLGAPQRLDGQLRYGDTSNWRLHITRSHFVEVLQRSCLSHCARCALTKRPVGDHRFAEAHATQRDSQGGPLVVVDDKYCGTSPVAALDALSSNRSSLRDRHFTQARRRCLRDRCERCDLRRPKRAARIIRATRSDMTATEGTPCWYRTRSSGPAAP